ncbi:hypothetical protein D3C74_48970 [compost metagenome]
MIITLDERETEFDALNVKRKGMIMINKDGLEIQCTESFVEFWKKRGFEIKARGTIDFYPEEKKK